MCRRAQHMAASASRRNVLRNSKIEFNHWSFDCRYKAPACRTAARRARDERDAVGRRRRRRAHGPHAGARHPRDRGRRRSHAALERPGSIALGQDAGLLAGVGKLSVAITDDPLDRRRPGRRRPRLHHARGDRRIRRARRAGAHRPCRRHDRLGADDIAKLDAAARHAIIIRSGNMSLGVNLLAGLVKRSPRRSARTTTSKSSRCTIA